jgi:hypothetical protein
MNTLPTLPKFRAWLALASLAPVWLGLLWLMLVAPAGAAVSDDPPGRVGRLAELQGQVSWFDHEQGQWGPADRNRPLTSGDRVSTGPDGRAELRVGSTILRLWAGSELEVQRLDDQRMVFKLQTGSVALRVRSRDIAAEVEVVTAEARLLPQRAGHYRFDRVDDSTLAAVWRGTLQVADGRGPAIETGQRLEMWREGRGGRAGDLGELRTRWDRPLDDAFAEWVQREDRQDERSAASRYVSPEMTGAEDLDRHGRWDQHPEYGAVWVPFEVSSTWAPYRYGRWAWVRPWGWTWVDDSRWGFAPFHYGRWVHWRGRWGWAPGEYVVRPVFAPALVAWVGGPRFSVSVNIGLPPVVWVPLAPREVFVPYYRHSPVYGERINVHPWPRRGPDPAQPGYPGQHRDPRVPIQVPTGPVMYGNQGVPGAVTAVPRDVLLQRQPVGRAVIDTRQVANEPLLAQSPVVPGFPAASPSAPANRVYSNGPVGVVAPSAPGSQGAPAQVYSNAPVPAAVVPAPALAGEVPQPRQRPERAADRADRGFGPDDDPGAAQRRDRNGDGVVDLRRQRPQPPQAPAAPTAPGAPTAPAAAFPTAPAPQPVQVMPPSAPAMPAPARVSVVPPVPPAAPPVAPAAAAVPAPRPTVMAPSANAGAAVAVPVQRPRQPEPAAQERAQERPRERERDREDAQKRNPEARQNMRDRDPQR